MATINVKIETSQFYMEKVKLTLCSINHCVMKIYGVSGGIIPCIFDLGTKWK